MADEVQAEFENCANEEELLELVFSRKKEGMRQQELESALTTYLLEVREEGGEIKEDEGLEVLGCVVGWCARRACIFS